MKFFLLVVVLSLFIFSSSYTQWAQLNSNTLGVLRDVDFVDDNNGWAIGDDGILKTTDGGANWSLSPIPYGASVVFVNQNLGFTSFGSSTNLQKTTNGGTSWTSITLSGFVSTLYFLNENIGFAAGAGGNLFKTTDGGTNWTKMNTGTSEYLNSVFFVNALLGFAAGTYGCLIKTTNGGDSWTSYSMAAAPTFESLYFLDATIGFVSGGNGIIMKTTDGGNSWVQQSSGSIYYINSIWFTDYTTGYAAGYNQIFKTTNGGNNWTPMSNVPAANYNSLCFSSSGTGYCVGYNGTILKYSSGSSTGDLVAYYPFNGNVNDVSGNGRNGVLYGATFTTDRFGVSNKALSFNGTSNYINIPGTNSLNFSSGGFSLCAWVNFTDATNYKAIVSKHISGYGNGFLLQTRPFTNPEFFLSSEPGLQSPDAINDGNWHFITGTYDGTTMKLYVDGTLKLNQPKEYTSTNDSTIMIGKHHLGVADDYFNGKIDDIRIYSRAITQIEILDLYNEGLSLNNGLEAYYPFNGNVNDQSGNNRHGVNYGAFFTTDRFGNSDKALILNGTSNFVDIPGTNNLHYSSGGFALCAWVNFTEATSEMALFGKHISGYGNGYYLMIRPATKPEFFITQEPGLRSPDALNNGQWHFITGNFDGTTMKLYVDGLLKDSQVRTVTNNNDSTWMIGRHHAGVTTCFYYGKIDDIRIYNRSLTDLEISALFNETTEMRENISGIPVEFNLFQNYPNPFNPSTTIKYTLTTISKVKLDIFNVIGELVQELINDTKEMGVYEVNFNASRISSGVYFYSIQINTLDGKKNFNQTKKMILVK